MFQIQNVPIAIEPGVEAIEAEFFVTDRRNKTRRFPAQLFRIPVDETTLPSLPFVPSVRLPHVFSLSHNPADSPVLVVYDMMGRISMVYTQDAKRKTWEKSDVSDEHAGKAVKQFSIRYFFGSERSRDEFMRCVDNIIAAVNKNEKPADKDVVAAFSLLSRSRTGPVVLPMAVANNQLRQVKL